MHAGVMRERGGGSAAHLVEVVDEASEAEGEGVVDGRRRAELALHLFEKESLGTLANLVRGGGVLLGAGGGMGGGWELRWGGRGVGSCSWRGGGKGGGQGDEWEGERSEATCACALW
jgi:hypothetical protein